MIKKIGQVFLLLFLIAFTSHSQEQCPFTKVTVRPFIAHHPERDSLSVAEILGAGKLATNFGGYEIVSFHIATGDGCIGGSGLYTELHCNSNYLTGEAARLLKRSEGQKFYFDHVHASSEDGKMYCLKPFSIFVKNPKEAEPCVSLPIKASVAGHLGAARIKLSEMQKAGEIIADTKGYEIISYKLAYHGVKIPSYQAITNNGAKFGAEVRQWMTGLEAGQQFGFIDIVVKDLEGKTFCLDDIVLVLQAE